MNIVDLLFNAASGGVVGSILHLGTSWFETYQARKKAEIDIMVMKAQMEAAANQAAWQAFTASQAANQEIQVSDRASPWVANIAELVDCFRSITRPALTWALLGVLVAVYFSSDEAGRQQMTPEITFGAFTAMFWWFGSRYAKK